MSWNRGSVLEYFKCCKCDGEEEIESGNDHLVKQQALWSGDDDGDNSELFPNTEAPALSTEQLQDRGQVLLEGGAVYTGQWLGEHRHGRGAISWPDGGRYEGQFREGWAQPQPEQIGAELAGGELVGPCCPVAGSSISPAVA